MNQNVVVFPKGHKGSPPQTIEESLRQIEEARKVIADDVIEDVVGQMFIAFSERGVQPLVEQDTTYLKCMGLVIESLRAIIMYSLNQEHPLQEVAGQLFKSTGPDEVTLDVEVLRSKIDASVEIEST